MDRSKTIIYNVYTQIDLSVAIYFGDLFHDHYIYMTCNWMDNYHLLYITMTTLQIVKCFLAIYPTQSILITIDLCRICASNSIFLFTTMVYLVQFLQGVMAAIFQLTIRVLLRVRLGPQLSVDIFIFTTCSIWHQY